MDFYQSTEKQNQQMMEIQNSCSSHERNGVGKGNDKKHQQ